MREIRHNEPRKRPRQARSQALVDALLGALTRILDQRGLNRSTSNEIAERAGVSIGSFYQYFPNKQALLSALIQKQARADIDGMLALLKASRDRPLEEVARGLVRQLIAHHRQHVGLYRVLLRAVPILGQTQFVRDRVRRARQQFQQFLEARRSELREVDTDLASFILGVSIEASLHAAILERPELLDRPEFERALVELGVRYLTPSEVRA